MEVLGAGESLVLILSDWKNYGRLGSFATLATILVIS